MPIDLPPGLPIIPDGEVPFSQRIFGVRPTAARAADVDAAGTAAAEVAGAAGGTEAGGAAPFEMSPEDFEAAVSDALLLIPDKAARAMDNVAIFIEDDYTPQSGDDPGTVLLGLYEGVPLTERGSWWDAGSLPDRITIFRQPILDICASRQDVIDEVAITVIHEIAHHFGIGDDRLHELGWG
ncbi:MULTISPECIES: metallopeptidase family protein [Arthrobacter]|uniref:Metallopeptidase family protein n=1 Tax=Arthrobacter terricola TaxID=2547396 RepID=A0A4R5KTZ9_9MICC|nr:MULTISPECIES: metallopeptidase family protein [Arthrobacter]MBT8160584.1 metallopeptidase family protein [Arthrobacter sp. GN70]TDF98387.1 metallopeptidase family protein [Arthrobacter terricola]